MKILKTIIWIFLTLFLIAVLLLGGILAYEKNSHRFWTPEELDLGFKLKSSKSDVFFKLGRPKDECEKISRGGVRCVWGEGDSLIFVDFNDKEQVRQLVAHKGYDYSMTPLTTESKLIETLGKPEIMSVTEGLTTRSYCYPKYNWCAVLIKGELDAIILSESDWLQPFSQMGEYYISGKKVCPSPNCPFDAEGKVLPDYKDKSYKHFLGKPD